MTTLITTAVLATMFGLGQHIVSNSNMNKSSGQLTQEQSLPLLRTLSKIHPINAIRDTQFVAYKELPHVCWITAEPAEISVFAPVARVIREATTESDWFMSYEVPYFCIFAEPRESGAHLSNWPRAPHSLTPLEIMKVRELAAGEIPALSSFIEERLGLTNKPSLGLDLTSRDLTLPGVNDYNDPGYKNVYLAADPVSFSPYEGRLTSEYDRSLHYGLTDKESSALELAVRADQSYRYTVLQNFFYEPYKDQRVLPNEVAKLKDECVNLRKHTADAVAVRALDKISSVANSAERYNLGVFLDSH